MTARVTPRLTARVTCVPSTPSPLPQSRSPSHHRRTHASRTSASILTPCATDGAITLQLAKAFEASQLIGVDMSTKMIEYASNEHATQPNLSFRVDDATHLNSIADASMDVLISLSTTHWVEDQRTMWQSFFRVLRPGGRLDVSTYPYNPSEYEPIRRVISTPKWAPVFADFHSDTFSIGQPLVHIPSTRDLQAMLNYLGFDVQCVATDTRHYTIANTKEYIKMLAPWHPWIAHVPNHQRQEFLADVEASYRVYVAVPEGPMPYTFDTVEIRAMKPSKGSMAVRNIYGREGMGVKGPEVLRKYGSKHARFSSVNLSRVDLGPFYETDVVTLTLTLTLTRLLCMPATSSSYVTFTRNGSLSSCWTHGEKMDEAVILQLHK